jgi:cob(I)alamin adenosyltransferase
MTKLYTGTGDDGTTGLYFGGRAAKDSPLAEAVGAADEAQAAIGLARAEAVADSHLHGVLTSTVRDLYVLMAELATLPENHHKLVDGQSRVTPQMVDRLEAWTDDAGTRFPPLRDFVIPGQNRLTGALDYARTVASRRPRR